MLKAKNHKILGGERNSEVLNSLYLNSICIHNKRLFITLINAPTVLADSLLVLIETSNKLRNLKRNLDS